jgi:hypothetical protein
LKGYERDLQDQALQAQKEIKLYQKETADKDTILDKSTQHFVDQSNTRSQKINDEVNSELAAFSRLSGGISLSASGRGFSLPSPTIVPHLADGGVVSSPTLAPIGEAGPEAIVPLGKSSGYGGTTINVTVSGNTISSQLDLQYLAQGVAKELVKTLGLNQRIAV